MYTVKKGCEVHKIISTETLVQLHGFQTKCLLKIAVISRWERFFFIKITTEYTVDTR